MKTFLKVIAMLMLVTAIIGIFIIILGAIVMPIFMVWAFDWFLVQITVTGIYAFFILLGLGTLGSKIMDYVDAKDGIKKVVKKKKSDEEIAEERTRELNASMTATEKKRVFKKVTKKVKEGEKTRKVAKKRVSK